MKRAFRTLLPLLLIITILTASMPAFAASSPTSKVIKSVSAASVIYSGKKRSVSLTVKDASGEKVSSKYYTAKMTFNGKRVTKGKKAGKYKVTVTGKQPYTGSASCYWYILKKNNFRISVKKSLKPGKTYTLKAKNAHGAKVTWSYPTSVFQKSGNMLYVKPGAKKGTYRITATAAGVGMYGRTTKTVKVKVRK